AVETAPVPPMINTPPVVLAPITARRPSPVAATSKTLIATGPEESMATAWAKGRALLLMRDPVSPLNPAAVPLLTRTPPSTTPSPDRFTWRRCGDVYVIPPG